MLRVTISRKQSDVLRGATVDLEVLAGQTGDLRQFKQSAINLLTSSTGQGFITVQLSNHRPFITKPLSSIRMAVALPRGFGFVCRACKQHQTKAPFRSISTIAIAIEPSRRSNKTTSLVPKIARRKQTSAAAQFVPATSSRRAARLPKTSPSKGAKAQLSASNPIQALASIRKEVSSIINAKTVPEDLELFELYNRIYEFSNMLVFGQPDTPSDDRLEKQGTSAILDDLDEDPSSTTKQFTVTHAQEYNGMSSTFRRTAAATVADFLYKLTVDPKVFIGPEILSVYTRTQLLLNHGEYIPEIFDLFAYKPIPIAKSNPIKYKNPWSTSPRYAIPHDLADAALEWAIQNRNIRLALGVIETSAGTQAWHRNRLIRKASLPCIAAASTFLPAYLFSDWLSTYQHAMDVPAAFWTSMAGFTAYLGTMITIGGITVLTWNDHHDRVVWPVGTPGWERYRREDERAMYDRVAVAWGFKERWRRGEEQGDEWEFLREEIGVNGLELDRVEQMDGME